MPNSSLRRMMMAQQHSAPSEQWDYEWDWKSGVNPSNASWAYTAPAPDGISYTLFKLNFADIVEKGTMEIVAKDSSTGNGTQYIIKQTSNDGAKVFARSGEYSTNIPGGNVKTGVKTTEMHKIRIEFDGEYILTVDDTEIFRGPGVKNNPYLDYCGVVGTGVGLTLQSIKWRGK